MVAAVRNGMGLGLLLCFLADDERDLVRLAEPANELDTDLWILSHPALKGVARIKALTDFLHDKLRPTTNCFTPVLDSVRAVLPVTVKQSIVACWP